MLGTTTLFITDVDFLPIFLTAIDVVTVYVFHEPSLLSSLQDNGLTGVMLKALVVKEVQWYSLLIATSADLIRQKGRLS